MGSAQWVEVNRTSLDLTQQSFRQARLLSGSVGLEHHLWPISLGLDLSAHEYTSVAAQLSRRAARTYAGEPPGGDGGADQGKALGLAQARDGQR
jgi:hypothetical protein